VIIDCAPTGSTIRMLGFPDILRWHMEHIFNWERKIVPKIKPLIERMTGNAFVAPDAKVYDSIEELYDKVSQLKEVLLDNKVTSMRLVLNPEKMVIAESQRAYTYLNLFGYSVDAVIANRVIPDSVTDPYFANWKRIQGKYLNLAHKCFTPLELLKAELRDDEMVGLERLKKLGEQTFGDKDPCAVLYEGRSIELEKADRHYFLYVKLPFVERSEVGVWIKGNELILEWGNFKSHTLLPGYLLDMNLEGARYRDGRIKITFGPAGHSLSDDDA
ncbi:MAG: ArsA family ATPase, partial [bacterium]